MDNNIFIDGWNHCNAYAFGWIMSDGCLKLEGRNKTAWAIRIASNDLQIMSWLHSYMCVGNKIYRQGSGYQIKFRNQPSIDFMRGVGLTPAKSLTMMFPDIPHEFLWDFIRGYFDGDGSIAITTNRYNTYAQVSFTSGSREFLISLQEHLLESGIKSQLYRDGRDTNSSYYLRITSRLNIERFFAKLYLDRDSPRLARKHEKFLLYLQTKPKYKTQTA